MDDKKRLPSPLHIDCDAASTSTSKLDAQMTPSSKHANDVIKNGFVLPNEERKRTALSLLEHTGHSLTDYDRSLKSEIESHPLYSVLKALVMQCEKATWALNANNTGLDTEKILRDFKSNKRDNCKLGANLELDLLMLQAISVLRIQLMELSKVNDLCVDFKHRYLAILKQRVSQEALLGIVGESDDEASTEFSRTATINDPNLLVASMNTRNGVVNVSLSGGNCMPDNCNAGVSEARPSHPQCTTTPAVQQEFKGTVESWRSLSLDLDDSSDEGTSSGSKRAQLPQNSVDVLKQWLFKNVTNPYPTEIEKRQLSQQTSLTVLQLNNWFINARRRILQPLLDVDNNHKTKYAPPDEIKTTSHEEVPTKRMKIQ